MRSKLFAIVGLAAVASLIGFTSTASAQFYPAYGPTRVVVSPAPVVVRSVPVYSPPVFVQPRPVFVQPVVPFYGSPVIGPGFGSPVIGPGFGSPFYGQSFHHRSFYAPQPGVSFGYSNFSGRSAWGFGVNIR